MEPNTSKHYILVPGSFHGAWCYYKLIPLLQQKGATVEALDLPGHGRDKTPVNTITLDSYVDAVAEALNKQPGQSVLVGHSRAGVVISQVAEKLPEKISSLVYLGAYLIPDSEPMVATALADAGSVLGPNLIFNEAEGWHIPKAEILKEAFYHDCPEEDVALAASLYCEEAIAPVVTPLHLSPDRYGTVHKVYIETLADKTISHGLQKSMLAKVPVHKTYQMDTSHSPFFSKPAELADILWEID